MLDVITALFIGLIGVVLAFEGLAFLWRAGRDLASSWRELKKLAIDQEYAVIRKVLSDEEASP